MSAAMTHKAAGVEEEGCAPAPAAEGDESNVHVAKKGDENTPPTNTDTATAPTDVPVADAAPVEVPAAVTAVPTELNSTDLPAAPYAEETKEESTAADVDTATAADVIAGAAKEEAAEETLKRKEAEAGDAEGGETKVAKSAKVAPDAAADAAAEATAA